jgi:hypothetical protein
MWTKDPDEIKKIVLDWGYILGEDVSISSSTFVAEGVDIESTSFTNKDATVFVSGGVAGDVITIVNTITASDGQTREQETVLKITDSQNLPEADIYNDIEGTNNYAYLQLEADGWHKSDNLTKLRALVAATSIINSLNFKGLKTDKDQVLEFPRNGDSEIPENVKRACSQIAIDLLNGVDPELEYNNLFMVSQGISSVRSTYDRRTAPPHIVARVTSLAAWTLILPYLSDTSTLNFRRV